MGGDRTGTAQGLARLADVAAVKDEPVVRLDPVAWRDALEQLLLNLDWRLARRQAGSVGDAEDMRVDRHRGFAERHVEHHVGGLAAHAGQGLQGFTGAGYLAAVLGEQEVWRVEYDPSLMQNNAGDPATMKKIYNSFYRNVLAPRQ